MTNVSGVRFRAYPSSAQAAALRVWIGHQRFIYNAKVREKRYWDRFARGALALTGLKPLPDQAYAQFISEDTLFLREVPPQILSIGAYRFATGCVRALKGLGGSPTIRNNHGRQSVLVTSKLFEWREQLDRKTGELRRELWLGTKKHPLGRLQFKAHRPFELPKMLSISVESDGRWYVSFCFQAAALDEVVLRTPEELAYEFGQRADLEEITVGLDRGVTLPVATSEVASFVIDPVCAGRVAKKERRARRYQRQLARQIQRSKRREKTKARIARLKRYGREVRKDFAHKTSFAIATSSAQVFVLEDLNIKNLTKKPAPKQDSSGRYVSNGAAAKAGLNQALLSSSLGLIRQFITYKAARRNKLVITVPAHYSSQECALCGHTAAENRPSQALFRCVQCQHVANADHNAASVLKKRGIALLREGKVVFKKRKTVRVRGRKSRVGPGRSEPNNACCSTSVESVSDVVGGLAANDAVLVEAERNRQLQRVCA